MDSKIVAHFKKIDPILYRLLQQVGESNISLSSRPASKYFRSLCSKIISQQLSGKVSDVFWERFIKLFPRKTPTPTQVLSLTDEQLRAIGISHSKVSFLKSLADHFVAKKINLLSLPTLPAAEVVKELTKIKGVGPWTADMFCMFTLGHPDIFSQGDQGLKNAIKKHYTTAPDPAVWSPFRTYACLILWKSLEL
jgi:DNA-3-methyladenine glycosylase II